jgi:hypothetical protein
MPTPEMRTSPSDIVVAEITARLEGKPSIWMKRRTLGAVAGYRKVPAAVLDAISDGLRAQGIYHRPADLQRCRLDDTVTFSRTPFADQHLRFPNERALGQFIEANWRYLAPFARCTRPRREFRLPSGRKIDLYLREGSGHVVCELEATDGKYETASQLEAYVNELRDLLVAKGRSEEPIRAVAVTASPNPREERQLRAWGARRGIEVNWYCYTPHLEFTEASD